MLHGISVFYIYHTALSMCILYTVYCRYRYIYVQYIHTYINVFVGMCVLISRLFIFMWSNVSVVNTMIFHGCRVEIFSFGIFPISFRLSLVLDECSRYECLVFVHTSLLCRKWNRFSGHTQTHTYLHMKFEHPLWFVDSEKIKNKSIDVSVRRTRRLDLENVCTILRTQTLPSTTWWPKMRFCFSNDRETQKVSSASLN